MSWYFKSINWGTSGFIASFGSISVCFFLVFFGRHNPKQFFKISEVSKTYIWRSSVLAKGLSWLGNFWFNKTLQRLIRNPVEHLWYNILRWLKAVNYFCKKFYFRCWTDVWIRLSLIIILWTVTRDSELLSI